MREATLSVPEAYSAAVGDGAVSRRSDRNLLLVQGRQPARMLTGIVSGSMPPEPTEMEQGVRAGRATYSLVLTPKAKVVTDLRLFRLEGGESGAHLMDVPEKGIEGLREHLKRYLPPRFARLSEPARPLGMLTVTGRRAAGLLSREALEGRVSPASLGSLQEGEERVLGDATPLGLRVARNGDAEVPAFDVLGEASTLDELEARLLEEGLVRMDREVWRTLRMERGRPAYGTELDRDVLPAEAGVVDRAVDHGKGCYTGQEVVVRVRDRGRVNRHLRGLLLGQLSLPEPGTPLFMGGRERAAGEVRSAVQSPRFGQGIALGYVRREAEPPAPVRLDAVDGPEVEVRALSDEGWELVEGDPGGR